jgi:hypothetical protein
MLQKENGNWLGSGSVPLGLDLVLNLENGMCFFVFFCVSHLGK